MKPSPDFKNNLSIVEEAGRPNYCYQCSSCLPECPAALSRADFNPREIVLAALLGITKHLTEKDSVIWECTTCYKCYERCPQGTHPVEVITALKNEAYKAGNAPDDVEKARENIIELGSLIPPSDAIEKRRRELGLPSWPSRSGQLRKIME